MELACEAVVVVCAELLEERSDEMSLLDEVVEEVVGSYSPELVEEPVDGGLMRVVRVADSEVWVLVR